MAELAFIRERIRDGLRRARAEGKRLGRPRGSVTPAEPRILAMLAKGASIRATATACGVAPATVQAAKRRNA